MYKSAPCMHQLIGLQIYHKVCNSPDIDGDFKMQLSDLAPLLLNPTKLVVKTINGNSVTGKDLLEYFKVTDVGCIGCVCSMTILTVGVYEDISRRRSA